MKQHESCEGELARLEYWYCMHITLEHCVLFSKSYITPDKLEKSLIRET